MKLRDLFRDHGLPWVNRNYLIEKETELATALELIAKLNADLDRRDAQISSIKTQLEVALAKIAQMELDAEAMRAALEALDARTPEPTGGESTGGMTE